MKKALSLFMSIVMLISITAGLNLKVFAQELSGSCGKSVTYTLNTETGLLTISGTGPMTDYSWESSAPWYNNRSSVKTVEIEYGVTSIGAWTFADCSSLTSVTIPNSVTSIGDNAFWDCYALTSVTIPNSVTSIGGRAFGYCFSLTSVTIPSSVTNMGDRAFVCCSSLSEIIVDGNNKNYTSQDGVLFNKDKTELIQCPIGNTRTSYTIPNSVTRIGDDAFYRCISLTSVTIPNSVTSIGESAFADCSRLTSVTIPNSVTRIDVGAFYRCSSLSEIIVDGNNQNYSSQDGVLFNKDKTALIQYPIGNTRTSYTIPNSVTSIGYYAFYNCSSLTSVTIPDSVTIIGEYAFEYCSSLTSITISNSVTRIGYFAFYNCRSLTSVTIPNSVTSIGGDAFAYCYSLTSVTIPNSVTSIGNSAFDYCYNLNDVYYSGSEAEWKAISISSSNECLTTATIHYNFDASHPTSTNSLYSSKFQSILDKFIFTKYRDSIYKNFKCIIPGIEQTNTGDGTYSNYMTPQGVCVAGSYILITAYDGINDYYKEMGKAAPESKKNSVIYVLDKKTNEYLTTVVLNSKCHVGGISYNQKAGLIYVADSDNKQICMLNYSDIVNAANSGNDAVKVEFSKCIGVNVNPSFVTYYGGYVYVGNFVEKKENEKNSILKAYNSITLTEISNSTIKLPLKSQGVAFFTHDNQLFMAVSCSHGRKNKSQVFAYRMKKSGNVLKKVSEFDCYKFPEMTEDICVYGDKFLTCYESAAAKYQNDNSPKGKCANPIDRITANSISKVVESHFSVLSLSESETQGNEEEFDDVVLSGSCGDDAEFVLYSNGLLNITGQGKLYNYAENEAPWSDYADEIAAVSIAPDIDSIGENSFVSCNNLEYIAVSEFSDKNEPFTISSNAFVGCNAIDTIELPDKSIVIADDAFKDSSTQIAIISDSQDAINYAEKNDLEIHNHNYIFVETIAPTCCLNGYDLYQCSCGSEDLRNVTEATSNHDYVLSDDTKVCLAGETQLYTCTKCQTTYDVEITEDCHSFSQNIVPPTYETEGYTEYTCTVCGYAFTDNYVDKLVTPTPDPTPSQPTTQSQPTTPTQPTTQAPTTTQPTTASTTVAPTTSTTAPITQAPTTTQPTTQAEITTSTTVTEAEATTAKPKATSIKKLTKGKKSFKATWKKISGVNGYQVQYSTDKKFKKNKKTVTIKKNTASATIKKLKAKKKYYVRVRSYKNAKVGGKTVKAYSSWSKVKSVKTK